MSDTLEPKAPAAAEDLGFDPDALRAKYRAERDKRLRADGNEQYARSPATSPTTSTIPMSQPGFTRAPLTDEVEVVVIGGGFGGLLAARAAARGRRRGHPHHREGRRLRRHLVLEPLSGRGLRHRELHLPAAAGRDRLHAGGEVRPRAGDPAPTAARSASTSTSTRDACFQTEVTEHALGRGRRALDRHDQPRRRHAGALRGHGQRAAAPAEAARHPGHRELQGPHLPHQPLGLRLHRRRLRTAG